MPADAVISEVQLATAKNRDVQERHIRWTISIH